MKKSIVLVYVVGASKEIHPAIYYLKEYVYKKWEDIHFTTKVYSQKKATSSIVKEILTKKPICVGFSTYIWNAKKIFQITHALRQKQIDLPIILGGPEASYNAQHILTTRGDVDVIAIDEGEETFAELTKHYYYEKKDLSNIKGIFFKKNGIVKHTGRALPLDLNKVYSPFLSGCISNIYHKIITYETSRGCPFKCAYCSYNTGSYARMRFFPLHQVLKEISRILDINPSKINIVDDNFNIYELRAIKILKQIRHSIKKTVVTFFLRADVWKISEELIFLLAHQNIFCTIGVQSLNPTTLAVANRIRNRKNLDFNIRLLNKHKVNFILQFIVGLPGDRYQDVQRMIDWAFQYAPYDIHLQTLRINPQTIYKKNASKYGIAYKKSPPYTIRKTKSMTPNQLIKSQMLASHFESIYKNRVLRKKLLRIHLKTHIPVSKIVESSMKTNFSWIGSAGY